MTADMIDWKKSGYLVETKSGKIGRTIHGKGIVNGKIPVYLGKTFSKPAPGLPEGFPVSFEETAILCDPTGLKQIGFID